MTPEFLIGSMLASFAAVFAFFQTVFILYMNSIKNDFHEMKNDVRAISAAFAGHLDDHLKGKLEHGS